MPRAEAGGQLPVLALDVVDDASCPARSAASARPGRRPCRCGSARSTAHAPGRRGADSRGRACRARRHRAEQPARLSPLRLVAQRAEP
jgi:hypothetical protein